MKTISEELLSLVLGNEVSEIEDINKQQLFHTHPSFNCINYVSFNKEHEQDEWVRLNIDTLTRKMKEWVVKLDYVISVYHHQDTVAVSITNNDNRLSLYFTPVMTVYTEFEAVLKATEWIAKEKGLL